MNRRLKCYGKEWNRSIPLLSYRLHDSPSRVGKISAGVHPTVARILFLSLYVIAFSYSRRSFTLDSILTLFLIRDHVSLLSILRYMFFFVTMLFLDSRRSTRVERSASSFYTFSDDICFLKYLGYGTTVGLFYTTYIHIPIRRETSHAK